MLSLTRIKWIGRLLQKGSIEESIKNFNELLSDAENSFQVHSVKIQIYVEGAFYLALLECKGLSLHQTFKS